MTNNPRVGVWAPTESLLDTLVEALHGTGSCEVRRFPTPKSMVESAADLNLAVSLGGRSALSPLAWSQLQAIGDVLPLLVIDRDPAPSSMNASMWLPVLPAAPMLGALVRGLVEHGPSHAWNGVAIDDLPVAEAPAAKPVWRRKADMILGESASTKRLLVDLERLAPSNALVLIHGESGTGKELVARALHYCGPRADQPFIAVNCAALPENLVESELFGYARGAFTGAVSSRVGAFDAAQKGTLFLDEIGEMPRAVQPKLLRVLETGEFTRLGSSETRHVAARLVVATNRDLETAVREGSFRDDLFYRLNVYPIELEPLRRRIEDAPAIIAHHLHLLAAKENRPTPRLSPAALERLLSYSWPGNVRQLVHVLTRSMILAPKNVIEPEHIELPRSGEQQAVLTYRAAKVDFDRDYYTRLLRLANGNVALAARLADKTRKEVYDALKRLQLDAALYRAGAELDET